MKRHAGAGDKETTPTPSSSASGADGEVGQKSEEWDDEAEGKGHEFALVTDLGRKWVLAVATRNDLEVSVVFPFLVRVCYEVAEVDGLHVCFR